MPSNVPADARHLTLQGADAVLCSNAFLAVTFALDNVAYTLSGTNMSDVATRRAARFDRQTDAAW
jgi:hypothetical protein